MSGPDSSPEPNTAPLMVVSSVSDQQSTSIITLGEDSGGLPGLLSPDSSQHDYLMQAQGVSGVSGRASGQYAITKFTAEGFIISSTEQGSGAEEIREGESAELNEATSEFVTGDRRASSAALSPHPSGTSRRESNVAISPSFPRGDGEDLFSSSSSEDESVDAFNKRGHQGSYVVRKGRRRARERGTGEGKRDTLDSAANERRVSSVLITPISTLDRSQAEQLLDFGGSSDESADEESSGRNHRSVVLRKGKRKRAPADDTIFVNPGAAAGGGGGDIEPIENESPEIVAIHPDTRKRIDRALHILENDSGEDKPPSSCDPQKCFPWLKATTEPPVSPELRRMQSLGFKMLPFFVFPAIPKLLQDIWVAVELFFTFFGLVFACVTFGSGGLASSLVVALSLVNLLLAGFDSFLYFVKGGSCASLFRWSRKRMRGKREPKKGEEGPTDEKQNESTGKEEEETKCFSRFRTKALKVFSVGSEVIRASLTELLLYPLAVLDLLELIDSQTYSGESRDDRINFGLLNIGLFYLVLTVYLIRIIMALSSALSISRLPKTTNTNYHNLLVKFSLHIIGQIVVHIAILLMVATKIDSEVCEELVENDGSGSGVGGGNETMASVNVSPFLIVTIITGDVIPFLGVAMFFVVNYPGLKQFMMGFCIDMVSTIVSEDFASTAFSGSGIKNVKRKTSKVHSKVSVAFARQQFNVYANVFSFKKKLSYRLTNPLVMIFSVAYFSLITLFLAFHSLRPSDPCDSTSEIKFITFSNHPGVFVTFIIGATAILVANYQVILLSIIWLMALAGLIVLVATAPLIILITAPLVATMLLVKTCI